jgi:hypothetical protein
VDNSGGAPRARTNVRRAIPYSARERLIFVCAAGAALALVQLAGSVPSVLAAAGILGVVGSYVPGAFGRAAAGSAIIVAAAGVAVDVTAATLLFGGLLVAGAWVGRTVSAGLPGLNLIAAVASNARTVRESVLLDERARTELTRARRYERPLSVITVRVDSDQRKRSAHRAVAAGRAMARALRVTDFVGVTEDGDAVAVLPDTRREIVADLIARVKESIAETRVSGQIGYATFPDDAVTWRELREAADDCSCPLAQNGAGMSHTPDRARLEGQRIA